MLVKAAAGGGGRGMRRAYSREELESAFDTARAEAIACFGNGEMYLEKLIENPRHIEFQILGDKAGNIIHLGERDCSIQRKNQKLIEESPSKALTPALRQQMGDAGGQGCPGGPLFQRRHGGICAGFLRELLFY